MAAGQQKVLAQKIDECLSRIYALLYALAVYKQRNIEGVLGHGRPSSSCFATRRSSTPARCFLTVALACTSSFGARSSGLTGASVFAAAGWGWGFLVGHCGLSVAVWEGRR